MSCFSLFLAAQNPTAEYHFNMGSTYDETGNENTLLTNGNTSAADDKDGSAGRAILLNQSYLYHENSEFLNMDEGITVSGWFNMLSFNGEWTPLINKWLGTEGSYYLGINPDNQTVRWNGFYDNIQDTEPMPINRWVHYAATYDGKVLNLYRDGNLVNSKPAEGELQSNTVPFSIGAQSNSAVPNYNGYVDEVYVYSSALSAEEIMALKDKTYQALQLDLVFLNMDMEKIQLASAEENLMTAHLFNNGLDPITSFDIAWDNGNTTGVLEIDNISLDPYETYLIEENLQLKLEVGDITTVNAEVMNVNGGDDEVLTNNSGNDQVAAYYFLPNRKVVIEEGTGTWCGWCPRGAVALDLLQENYPDEFIGIAVHNGDIMTVDEYDSGIGFVGFPSCHVDRTLLGTGISPAAAEFYVEERLSLANIPSASVSEEIIYDHETRTVTIEAKVVPALALSGDYRLSFVITEDEVAGTLSQYNQANFYAGGIAGVMGGYEVLPNPVPAADMIYNHVARAVIGGVRGEEGSLPTDMNYGEEYAYSTSYMIPEELDLRNLHIVAMLLDGSTQQILNADSKSLDLTGVSVEDHIEDLAVRLFPNPTNSTSQLTLQLKKATEVSVKISNLNGQVLATKAYGLLNGAQILPINASNDWNGIYLVTIQLDDQQIVKKLQIQN